MKEKERKKHSINVYFRNIVEKGNEQLEIKRLNTTTTTLKTPGQSDVISWFNDLFDELQCYKVETFFFSLFYDFSTLGYNGDVANAARYAIASAPSGKRAAERS